MNKRKKSPSKNLYNALKIRGVRVKTASSKPEPDQGVGIICGEGHEK